MRHPWDDSDYPRPLYGHRTAQERPSAREAVLMALLLIGMILVCGLTEVRY